MKSHHLTTVLALALLSDWNLQAQALPETLVKAARQAVTNHPEVQARWNGFKAARSEQDMARAGYLPQLDLSVSVGRQNRTKDATDYGNYPSGATQLTLNQMLFDGRLTAHEVKRLGFAKLTRYYELAEVSEAAALQAVRAYSDVLRARELIEVATENYVEHKQTMLQLEERTRAGVGKGADLEQANGRLALAESSLLTELTKLHDASARYLNVVGEKPPAKLPSLPEPFRLGQLPASVEALMRDGLAGSPTLQAALENANAYQQAVASRQAAFLPRLDLQAYQSTQRNLDGVAGNTHLQGAKLALNDNLYRGGADQARVSQARAQQQQALALREQACRDVRQTLSNAYSDVHSLSEQLKYRDAHRLAAEKSRVAYRQQFNLGQRSLLDLLDNQNEFFEAARAYINARHDQIGAQARTLASMGQLVTSLGVARTDVPTPKDAGQERSGAPEEALCPPEETTVDTVDAIKARFAKAPSGSYVVLIPSPDGSVGKVTVQGKGGVQELTQARQRVPLDGSAAPVLADMQEVERDLGAAMAARPPLPEQFVLYFHLGGTQLTQASKAVLPQIIARARARQTLDIWLVGHADTVGTAKRNEALGLQRARFISQQLRRLGLKNVAMTVESFGEQVPQVATPDETDEPRNRRGEVTLR